MREAIMISWAFIAAAIECGRRGLIRGRVDRETTVAVLDRRSGEQSPIPADESGPPTLRSLRSMPARTRTRLLAIGVGLGSALTVLQLIGPLGLAAGTAAGAIPFILERRKAGKVSQELEKQLAEVAESTAMAVRSGFSITQALQFAAEEASDPMSAVLGRHIQEQDLGMPFEEAIRRFADQLGNPDAHLFALVVTIHARSGGNLAGALDEVAATIRHRIAVRRELRALSAQGRISGSILGALPMAFFLVLAATSHRDLAPVYRSRAGVAMILSGLVLEGIAFAWIRRLLLVEA
ncbi:MAG TPA: type II secretion system F family protein [Actinomycetota bacterium]|nr:type II secretion system F family protein [Actinomycetota bacterium]